MSKSWRYLLHVSRKLLRSFFSSTHESLLSQRCSVSSLLAHRAEVSPYTTRLKPSWWYSLASRLDIEAFLLLDRAKCSPHSQHSIFVPQSFSFCLRVRHRSHLFLHHDIGTSVSIESRTSCLSHRTPFDR